MKKITCVLLVIYTLSLLSGLNNADHSSLDMKGFGDDITQLKIDSDNIYKVKNFEYITDVAVFSFQKGYFYLMTPVVSKEAGILFIGKVDVNVKADNPDFSSQIEGAYSKKEYTKRYKTMMMFVHGDFIGRVKEEGSKKKKSSEIDEGISKITTPWFDFSRFDSPRMNIVSDILNSTAYGAFYACFFEDDLNECAYYNFDGSLNTHEITFINKNKKRADDENFSMKFVGSSVQNISGNRRREDFSIINYDMDVKLLLPQKRIETYKKATKRNK